MGKSKLEQLNYRKHDYYAKPYFKHKYEQSLIVINEDSVHLVQQEAKIELSFDEVDAIYDEMQRYKLRKFIKNERYRQEDGAFITVYQVKDTTISYIIDGEENIKTFDQDSVYARTLMRQK